MFAPVDHAAMSESNGHGGGETGHRTDPGVDPADGRDPRDESTQVAIEDRRRNTTLLSGIVAVLGFWIAVSPFLLGATGSARWNNVLVGALICLAAAFNAYRVANDIPLSVGVASLVALLGLWAVVAVGLFEMGAGLRWTTAAAGLLVTGIAGYNAYEAREARAVATDRDVTN